MKKTVKTVYDSCGITSSDFSKRPKEVGNMETIIYDTAEVPQVDAETAEKQLPHQGLIKLEIIAPLASRSAKISKHLKTLLGSLAASLGSVSLGTIIGYTAPAIPDLNAGRNPFHLNDLEISVVASIVAIGGLIGGLFGGFLSDKYGRKMTIVSTTVPFAVGWAVIAASPNVYCLCVGRFLTGICAGIMDVGVPVYISEISAPSVRGFMGSCYELGTNLGLLFVFAFGCFLHWDWLAIACLCLPVVQLFCMLSMPESPRWLLSKGHKQETLDTLHWLRGEDEDVSAEMSEMEENIRLSSSKVEWREFAQPSLYRPLLIIVGLMFFQQACGYGTIPEYLVSIFDSAGNKWDPYAQTAVYGAVGFFANFLSAFLVDRAGRRIMLFISASLATLCLAGLSTYFTVKSFAADFDVASLMWLPTVSLFGFNFSISLGYGPVPFYMAGELIPLRVRGLVGGIAISCVWLFQFIVSLAFPHLLIAMSDEGVYWMMAAFALLGLIFAFFFVPETKGRSLEEIEEQFRK